MSGGKNLHGVDNLTKDRRGNVFWKGVHVDRYTFKDEESERYAALSLAEECERIEAFGIPVSDAALFDLKDRIRWAMDVPHAPKWVIFVCTSLSQQWLKTMFLGTSGGRTVEELQGAIFATLSNLDLPSTFTRAVPISQREHLEDAVEIIKREVASAESVWMGKAKSEKLAQCAAHNINEILTGTWIDRSTLPTAKRARFGSLNATAQETHAQKVPERQC